MLQQNVIIGKKQIVTHYYWKMYANAFKGYDDLQINNFCFCFEFLQKKETRKWEEKEEAKVSYANVVYTDSQQYLYLLCYV